MNDRLHALHGAQYRAKIGEVHLHHLTSRRFKGVRVVGQAQGIGVTMVLGENPAKTAAATRHKNLHSSAHDPASWAKYAYDPQRIRIAASRSPRKSLPSTYHCARTWPIPHNA